MPVVWQWYVICPILFRILQYLQSILFQKLKPHSLAEVPVGLGFRFNSREAFGSIALGLSESLVRNWSILSCLTPGKWSYWPLVGSGLFGHPQCNLIGIAFFITCY